LIFEVVALGEIKPDRFHANLEKRQARKAGRKISFSTLAILVNGNRLWIASEKGVRRLSLGEELKRGKAIIERYEVPIVRPCCAITWLERSECPKASWLPWPRSGRRSVEYVADFLHDLSALPKHYFENSHWQMPFHIVDLLAWLSPSQAARQRVQKPPHNRNQ
jgi:hypothetical protein